jgi:hypothetical protein
MAISLYLQTSRGNTSLYCRCPPPASPAAASVPPPPPLPSFAPLRHFPAARSSMQLHTYSAVSSSSLDVSPSTPPSVVSLFSHRYGRRRPCRRRRRSSGSGGLYEPPVPTARSCFTAGRRRPRLRRRSLCRRWVEFLRLLVSRCFLRPPQINQPSQDDLLLLFDLTLAFKSSMRVDLVTLILFMGEL